MAENGNNGLYKMHRKREFDCETNFGFRKFVVFNLSSLLQGVRFSIVEKMSTDKDKSQPATPMGEDNNPTCEDLNYAGSITIDEGDNQANTLAKAVNMFHRLGIKVLNADSVGFLSERKECNENNGTNTGNTPSDGKSGPVQKAAEPDRAVCTTTNGLRATTTCRGADKDRSLVRVDLSMEQTPKYLSNKPGVIMSTLHSVYPFFQAEVTLKSKDAVFVSGGSISKKHTLVIQGSNFVNPCGYNLSFKTLHGRAPSSVSMKVKLYAPEPMIMGKTREKITLMVN